jgi:hypothetical protein
VGLAEVQAFQSSVDDVGALALADTLTFWRGLDVSNPPAVDAELRAFLPDLFDAWVPLAAEVGASFYEEARDSAGAPGVFTVELAEAPSLERVNALAGWAASPLFSATPSVELALSKLVGGAQRVVSGGARDTVELAARKDPGEPKFARHASANACAFCAMLATRGPAYRSEGSAGGKYHDHCHCVAVPVWGDEYEPAPYVKRWESAYVDARSKLRKPTTQDTLTLMRQSLGAA